MASGLAHRRVRPQPGGCTARAGRAGRGKPAHTPPPHRRRRWWPTKTNGAPPPPGPRADTPPDKTRCAQVDGAQADAHLGWDGQVRRRRPGRRAARGHPQSLPPPKKRQGRKNTHPAPNRGGRLVRGQDALAGGHNLLGVGDQLGGVLARDGVALHFEWRGCGGRQRGGGKRRGWGRGWGGWQGPRRE